MSVKNANKTVLINQKELYPLAAHIFIYPYIYIRTHLPSAKPTTALPENSGVSPFPNILDTLCRQNISNVKSNNSGNINTNISRFIYLKSVACPFLSAVMVLFTIYNG